MKTLSHLIVAAAVSFIGGRAWAYSSITWQNSLFDPLPLLQNDGPLLDGSFAFELGTFNGITPTLANIDQWETSWKLLSVGTWSPGSQQFGGGFTFNPDGTVSGLTGSSTFAAGEQAYLWVRNATQWSLVTDDLPGSGPNNLWTLPDPASDPGSAINWTLSTANHPVIGGVNGVQSGTPYAYDPGSSFRLQTAVVPEPSAVVSVLVSGAMVFRRRRTQV